MKLDQGKFIVFEGIDGAGKGTQIDLLLNYFRDNNIPFHHTCEPTNHEIGKLIRKGLSGSEKFNQKTLTALFVADRIHHIENDVDGILSLLNQGIHVICDRYDWSSYAYHSLTEDMDWVIQMNGVCRNLLEPDLTLFLDLPVEVSLNRINIRNESKDIFEKEELLKQIQRNYYQVFKKLKGNIEIIDANKPIEDIQSSILNIIKRTL